MCTAVYDVLQVPDVAMVMENTIVYARFHNDPKIAAFKAVISLSSKDQLQFNLFLI